MYAIIIFNEANSVATTTKFRQKYVKTAHILVLYKVGRPFFARTVGFSGLANSNMLSEFFREQMTLPWQPNLGKN